MQNAPEDLKKLSGFLDSKYEGPGGFRFGWDAILGLIPGVGDFLTGTTSVYIIIRAALLGCPPVVLIRMGFNVLVENVVDLIPFFGNLFDFVWKSNLKNLILLERYLAIPQSAVKRSGVFVWTTVLIIILLIAGFVVLSFYLLLRLLDFAF